MMPLALVALGGGAFVGAVAVRGRQTSLLDRLTPMGQAPKAQAVPKGTPDATAQASSRDVPHPVRGSLTRLDDRYQTFVQTHLDPWLAGQLRDQHMLALTQRRHQTAECSI
jgi:hypothetical protein